MPTCYQQHVCNNWIYVLACLDDRLFFAQIACQVCKKPITAYLLKNIASNNPLHTFHFSLPNGRHKKSQPKGWLFIHR